MEGLQLEMDETITQLLIILIFKSVETKETGNNTLIVKYCNTAL